MPTLDDLKILDRLANLGQIGAQLKELNDLLTIVGAARESLSEISAQEAAIVVRKYLDGKLTGPRKQALDSLVSTLGLGGKLAQVRTKWKALPDEGRALIARLDETDLVEFSLLNEKLKPKVLDGPWKSELQYEVDTALKLEVEGLDDGDSELSDLGIVPGTGNSMLNLELAGRLGLKGGGNIPFSTGALGGSIGGSAGIAGGAAVSYYFRNRSDTLLAVALREDLPCLVSPFEIADIEMAGKVKLSAVRFQADGNLNLSMNASAAAVWGTTVSVESESVDLKTEAVIGVGASAEYSTDIKLEGAFELLFLPNPNGGPLTVRLLRSRSDEKRSTFNVDASVGVTGLDEVGRAVIKKYIPDSEELLRELEPYLDLGTMLDSAFRDRLSSELGKLPKFVQKALLGTMTGATTDSEATAIIWEELKIVTDTQLDLLSGDAKAKGTELVGEVADRIGLPVELRQRFTERIGVWMARQIEQIKAELQEKLNELVQGKSNNVLVTLLKPLADLGANVNTLIQQSGDLAKEILEPTITFIERYQEYRNKLVKAVEGAAKLRVALSYSRSLRRTASNSVVLEFKVDPANERAGELVRQMLLGSFQEALEAARQQMGGSQGIELIGGTFAVHLGHTVDTGINIDLIGFTLGSRSVLRETVDANWDVGGNVLAIAGTTDFQRTSKALSEWRSLRFFNLFELASSGKGNAGLAGGLAISVTDEKLHSKELRRALESLEDVGLIALGSTARALDRWDDLHDEYEDIGATYGFSYPLTQEDLRRFAGRAPAAIIDSAISNQVVAHYPGTGARERFRSRLHLMLGDQASGNWKQDIKAIHSLFTNRAQIGSRFKHLGQVAKAGKTAWTMVENAHNLVTIRAIVREMLDIRLDPVKFDKQAEHIHARLSEYNDCLKGWLKAYWTGRDRLPKKTLAFVRTIHDLTGQPNSSEPPLVPVIKWDLDGEPLDELIV